MPHQTDFIRIIQKQDVDPTLPFFSFFPARTVGASCSNYQGPAIMIFSSALIRAGCWLLMTWDAARRLWQSFVTVIRVTITLQVALTGAQTLGSSLQSRTGRKMCIPQEVGHLMQTILKQTYSSGLGNFNYKMVGRRVLQTEAQTSWLPPGGSL